MKCILFEKNRKDYSFPLLSKEVTEKYFDGMRKGAFLVNIQIWKKSSHLRGFEPTTYQVTVYDAVDIPMCHRASVKINLYVCFH